MMKHPDDLLRPFQIESAGLRGRLVRLGPALDRIVSGHGYDDAVAQMVGQATALAALLAGALKFDGVFTLQTKGDGPISMLMADYASPGTLRAFAQYDADRLAAVLESEGAETDSVPRLMGGGYIAFTIDQGEDTERYQGIVSLEGATLAECAHAYFRESEQLETALLVAAAPHLQDGRRQWRAGGLMLQRLPEGDPALIARGAEFERSEESEDAWRRAVGFLASARREELVDPALSADDLLFRLFHEDGVRVFESQPLAFGCRCSGERVETVLRSLTAEERGDLKVDGRYVVKCEFCAAEYTYTEDELNEPA